MDSEYTFLPVSLGLKTKIKEKFEVRLMVGCDHLEGLFLNDSVKIRWTNRSHAGEIFTLPPMGKALSHPYNAIKALPGMVCLLLQPS